eukprot:13081-Prymnesium_polylepis.1
MHDVAAAHLLNRPHGVPGLVESLGCLLNFHSDPSLRDGLASQFVSSLARPEAIGSRLVGADRSVPLVELMHD